MQKQQRKRERVLIAGAGYVGSCLAKELFEAGHDVSVLRRNPHVLPNVYQHIEADLTQPETFNQIPENIDVVFYTAAANGKEESFYSGIYRDGLQNIVSFFEGQSSPPRLIVYVSSSGVYGQVNGEWVDEQTTPEPIHMAGRWVYEGEKVLQATSIPSCSVRFSGIYGPGRTRVIGAVRRGSLALRPDDDAVYNQIHRDDCVGVLHHVMQLDQPPAVLNATDSLAAEKFTVWTWLAEQLGLEAPTRDADLPPPERPRGHKRVANVLLHQSGYTYRYPTYVEGYRSLIESGAQGLIRQYDLKPHPEGGHYQESYRADETVEVPRGTRATSTAIYYLLEGEEVSRLHRIKSDEAWHYYRGSSPLVISMVDPEGQVSRFVLSEETPFFVVPKGVWFGSECFDKNGYAFVGCTVAPGFDFDDFEMANRKEFLEKYPNVVDSIKNVMPS